MKRLLIPILLMVAALGVSNSKAQCYTPVDAQVLGDKYGSNVLLVEVLGSSMSDCFPSGSILISERTTFERVSIGMVIVYKDDSNRLIAHKVVATKKDDNNEVYYITQGTQNKKVDTIRVTPSNFVSIVRSVIFNKLRPSKLVNKKAQETDMVACALRVD
jgi:signal peptidase I